MPATFPLDFKDIACMCDCVWCVCACVRVAVSIFLARSGWSVGVFVLLLATTLNCVSAWMLVRVGVSEGVYVTLCPLSLALASLSCLCVHTCVSQKHV